MVDAFNLWLLLKIGRYEENCFVLSTLNSIFIGCNYWAVKYGS